MKSIPLSTIVLVAVASLVTLVASVFIAVNYYVIQPKDLAKTITNNPEAFAEAFFAINDDMRKYAQKKQQELASKKLEKQFENPIKISTEGRVTKGDSKAPVTVVEYFDFQCGYCALASNKMKNLIKKYEGKVNLVYKHFPLSFHPFAQPAAVYFEAIAMESHDKAKKFHDLIFDNFDKYSKLKDLERIQKALDDLAKAVGADKKALNNNKEKAQALVKNDKEEGEKAGVSGTPSFVINGVMVPRNKTPEEIIDKHLKN